MLFAGAAVFAFALFLLGLAATLFLRPDLGARFLGGFAGTARAHYAELAARLVVGSALVVFAPEMWPAALYRLFGWVVVATTLALSAVPWRWHRRFARRVVPPTLRYPRLLGAGAALLGAVVLYGLAVGHAGPTLP